MAKYNWKAWFEKGRFKLVRGRDYRCSNLSMAQQVRNNAGSRGLKVTVLELDDGKGLAVEVRQRPSPLPSGKE